MNSWAAYIHDGLEVADLHIADHVGFADCSHWK